MIEGTVSWGSLLNLGALVVAAMALGAKISKGYADLQVKIEQYHSENSRKISALEAEMRWIRQTLRREGGQYGNR